MAARLPGGPCRVGGDVLRRQRSAGAVGPDEWKADFATVDPQEPVDGEFDVPGKGEVLDRWDGATVTCYLWEGEVIGVRLPDGTVLKGEDVGWHGLITRWASGVLAIGVALLIGGFQLSMGYWARFAARALLVVTVMMLLHLNWLWVALVVDVVAVLAAGWWIARRRRSARAGASGGGGEGWKGGGTYVGPPG